MYSSIAVQPTPPAKTRGIHIRIRPWIFRPREKTGYGRPVAEDPRPPVAIRVVRPYKTEDELLEAEGETITKTTVVLLGALHRPQGVVLRFELTLATGEPLIRGEGRVTAYRERAHGDQPGLALRFTRLDPKSKAFVDRAVAQREAAQVTEAPPPAPSSPETEAASEPSDGPLVGSTPSASTFSATTVRPPTAPPMDPPTVPPPPDATPPAEARPQPEEQPTRPVGGSVLPPAETRAPALERLRARGAAISGRSADMLAKGRGARAGLERLAARRGSRAS